MSNSTGHAAGLELDEMTEPAGSSDVVHVVVATREEELLWAVFDGFCELPTVRVTGCSTLPQTRQICAADPAAYLIIDMGLLEHEPMDLITLANLSDSRCHIVALTTHPVFEIGARSGSAAAFGTTVGMGWVMGLCAGGPSSSAARAKPEQGYQRAGSGGQELAALEGRPGIGAHRVFVVAGLDGLITLHSRSPSSSSFRRPRGRP